MIATLHMSAEAQRKIRRDERLAAGAGEVMAAGTETACVVGADSVRRQLVMGELGLTMRNPASGLAAAVEGRLTDASKPEGVIGVPGNSPAAAYARIQQYGGTIRPKSARALAVPVSDEARRYTSPRDMQGLDLIPRKGRPSLLVRQLAARGGRQAQWEIHWVLVPSVTIRPTHWLSRGVEEASGEMSAAFADRLDKYVRRW